MVAEWHEPKQSKWAKPRWYELLLIAALAALCGYVVSLLDLNWTWWS
jgi:hypothetical protein